MARFKCSKCDRVFGMPAHLGRHMNTIHRRGTRRKSGSRAVRLGTSGRSAQDRGSLIGTGAVSDGTTGLIQAREAYYVALVSQRETIDSQIESLQGAMSSIGASSSDTRTKGARGRSNGRRGSRSGRPPARSGGGMRRGSLKESILKILRQRNRPMSPREIANAVKSTGYKTKSSDLTKAVSNVLPGLTMLNKAGRGLYRA